MVRETHARSIVKSITWRVVATLTTFVLVLVFTKDFIIAFSISSVEVVMKLAIYYLHERFWGKLNWGIVK